jgi:hypothetical protein
MKLWMFQQQLLIPSPMQSIKPLKKLCILCCLPCNHRIQLKLQLCYANAHYAVHSADHCTLNVSPGAMVFHHDMVLPIPLIADFEIIWQHCQAVVDDSHCCQNLHHLFHDYNVGDEVLILNQNKNKPMLAPASVGPLAIQLGWLYGLRLRFLFGNTVT